MESSSAKTYAKEEKETPKGNPDALFYQVPSNEWVLNKEKLRAALAAEGFRLVENCDNVNVINTPPNGVLFLNESQVADLPQRLQHTSGDFSCRGMLWRLIDFEQPVGKPLHISRFATKQTIRRWLDGDDKECIVCYEDKIKQMVVCECGYMTCVGCTIDMLSLSETEMIVACSNCRCERGALINLYMILNCACFFLKEIPAKSQMECLTETRLAFIKKITGVDLTLPRHCAETQRFKSTLILMMFSTKPGVHQFHEWSAETRMNVYNEMRRGIEYMREVSNEQMALVIREFVLWKFENLRQTIESFAKKKGPSASADSSSAALSRPRFGCAHCGKQFWDKSEWKRAPKCLKCKRTAYCCAKCRKAHRRAHAGHCTANAKKAKRKPKKKHRCASY